MKAVVFLFGLLPAMGMADDRRAENDKVHAAGVQATEPQPSLKRPLVGAIRWDGWGIDGDVGKGAEQVLGLAKYQHRAPFFVAEAGADSIRFKPYSQEIMDTEIDYAVHAGIDYWAFCWYPPGCGLEVARNLFLSSRKQLRPKWCVILGTMTFDLGRDAPWLAAEFAKPGYQKVLDGRPLVYVFTPMPRADLAALRELSLKSCGKSPYVAMMGWTATSAAQACEAVGADAITRYAGGEWGSWEDYAKVKELIPNVGIGWDPTPFRDTPMPWYPPVAKDFVGSTATPQQIVAGMESAFKWIRANPAKVPTNTLLIYAWNEHAEGGWLCPTFTPQGPNNEKIDALHEWMSRQPPLLHAAGTRDTLPDTWAAADALGRVLPMSGEVGAPKPDRTVGIFYFNWHAAFGNPQVHDIAKILKANPNAPQWGPVQAPHYWSEPRFGYYRPDDPWVIRKHVQMLTDAGVDVLILDATNGFTYDTEREALCRVLEQMKAEGHRVPGIALFAYARHQMVVQHLWETFYKPGKHRDLWFRWKGKPLLLTPTEGLSEDVKDFFSIRTSWAWTRGQPWFGDGKDRWPWLDHAPQVAGWHVSPDKAECVPVGVSQHATSNIGRSFHGSRQPPPAECRPGEGLYFDEQWRHALPHQPEFIFITGWNEWIAQRFLSDGTMTFQGRVLPPGETFFVDLYDPEFNRDIEPMRGGYGDNTYWQMIANIRRYKGARPVPAASPARTIVIPGDFAQWTDVKPVYLDDLHDTTHRDHDGVAGAGRYTNRTGRNDLDTMHVTRNATHLFFHCRTRDALTLPTDANWMLLWLDTDQDSNTGRLGYDCRINRSRSAPDASSIERWNGNAWEPAGTAKLQAGPNEIHLAVERSALGVMPDNPLRFDFKWTDNVSADPDGIDFLDQGDTAPNGRFNYRFNEGQAGAGS